MCYTRHEPVGICGAVIPVRAVNPRVNRSWKIAWNSTNIEIGMIIVCGYNLKNITYYWVQNLFTYPYIHYLNIKHITYKVFWF